MRRRLLSVRAPRVLLCHLFFLGGCVSFPGAPAPVAPPTLAANALQAQDGALLGLQAWRAQNPRAVILALHGMNDYANAFAMPGAWWAENADITTYAIDQRGFGRSPERGRWVGGETLKADLRAALDAIGRTHPDLPVYVLGHSMGAAVVIAAQEDAALNADGLVLAAPGVWGGSALPLTHRLAANIAASLTPGKTLTGERAGRQSTDNTEVLRAMSRDPLMIGATRLDAVLGVVRIMGEAYDGADKACADTLVLIGEKDEIIPLDAMEETAASLCGSVDLRRYENGWHLLFRDLEAKRVWRDVAGWIDARVEKPAGD